MSSGLPGGRPLFTNLETDVINTMQALDAVARHDTRFFDMQLNPIVPQPGQWFCEYDDEYDEGQSGVLRDEAMVEYVGRDDSAAWCSVEKRFVPWGKTRDQHLVAPEHGDGERRPKGLILVRQS